MATLNGVNYSNTSGLLLKTNATTQISISTAGVIEFNQSYTFPTSDGSANTVLLTNGSGALSFSTIPNASLDNSSITINGTPVSLGGSINVGDITGVSAGTGLSGGGTSGSVTLSIDYLGTDNFIDSATNLEGTAIATTDTIIYHDASDNNVKKGLVSDLPFTNTSGTVTSVAISGSDGIDVDSGSPITSSGTIALGLSNVPNSVLANSSMTFNVPTGGDPVVSLGGTFNIISSNSSVTISGNSSTDTIDLTVGDSVNTYVTGGTFTSGTLSLGLNDGSSAQDITGLWSSIPNAALSNSSLTVTAGNGLANGGSVSLGGSVTLNVGAAVGGGISVGTNDISLDTSNSRNVDHDNVSISTGTGLSGGGTIASNRTISLDYAGTDNFIDSATNLEGTSIALTDTIVYHDATDNNVKKGLVSDLPFTNSSGSVTSVAISGTDGIDVDSGSPITSSGTITLGLSSVPNSSLANSSVTVTAGNGLINGGSVSLGSSVTLNVGAGTGISVAADTVGLDYAGTDNFIDSATDLEGTSIATTDTIIYHDATDNNVKKGLVSDLPFTNTSGTVTSVAISGSDGIDVDSGSPITSSGTIALGLSNVPNASLANSSVTVTAGNGLVNGGSVSLGSSVTLNVGAGTGISVAADTVGLDYAGTDNFIDSATDLEGTDIAGVDTIVYHDATDNNVKKGLVSDLPFTDNTGTVTSVGITAGALIDVTNSPITTNGNITVAVDLSELTTSTSNGDGDYFVVVDSSNVQRKLTKANINNSGFNNDAGYITSAGNTNIYSSDGSLSGTRTITQSSYDTQFRATATESTKFYRSTNTSNTTTRVFMEADDSYQNVLELYSTVPSTNLIDGYDAGQAPVFTVDGQGNLTAISKAFDIPHPNPEKQEQGMRLKHGNLEGPEHGVYVRGRQIDDKEIELPEYWRDLVDPDSITVQLTSVGSHQNLYVKKIEDNVVYIGNGNLFSNKIDCYYFIQAERKDIDKIQVEYTK